jgi:threonine/homoserine/homoserine lactone efflux protein
MNELTSDPRIVHLALLAVSSSLSPGPNNLLIAASGAWFGARRSLPTLAGMYAGFGLMFLASALGAAAVFDALPWLLRALQYAGAAYLLRLALGLLQATWSVSPAARPIGFGRAAALQFVNPKMWLMTIATLSMCTRAGSDGERVSLPLVAFFVAMTMPSMLLYLKSGALLESLATSDRGRRIANRVLAALTAASSVLLVLPPGVAR